LSCAVGAIGGAASAIAAPLIRDTLYADSPVQKYSDDSVRQALTVGLATLIGGAAGALLGTDATSAALAAQNEALNNATSLGPARGALAQENARLTKQCEPSCTRADFDRIDTEVRTLEANLALARMDNLTPEQALRLADTLSNLLPYYGSAAMLYQAVTGQTLSGQELGTADRWLSGILGAIPAGAAAYGKISEFVAAKGIGGGATGTVWDSIKATQPTYPGSVIPKSFEMSLPNGQSVWVHGNATEHLAEYAQMVATNNPPNVVRLTTQQQLASLQGAVNTATRGSVPYNQLVNVGGWELKFAPPRQPGQMPALIHALPTGK